MTKIENKKIQSKNGNVYYWIGGNQNSDARCIIFVHGLTADHSMFDKQVDYFSKEFKVITIDVPLHGKSRPYKDFSLKNVTGELMKILDTENLSQVVLVGQSMGGYICQEFAIHYPNKVQGFIGVDTNPFGHYYYPKWERYILSKVGSLSSLFPYKLLVKSIAKGATRTDHAFRNMYASVSQLSKNEIIKIMDVCYEDFLERKETVAFNFPVLLVIGDKDNTGNVKKYNKKWSARDGYPLTIINGAAHNSNIDNYNEFNRVVEAFLKRI